MAKQKEQLVNFFNFEDDFGGGAKMPPGFYRLDDCKFILWDMNGKAGVEGGLTFFTANATPVDPKTHKGIGEPVMQRWLADFGNKGSRQLEPNDAGTGLVATDAFLGKMSKTSDFGLFMQKLSKSGFDCDQYDNDISVLDGQVFEFGEVPQSNERADGKKFTTPVPVNYPAQVKGGGSAKGIGTKETAKEQPKKGGAKKQADDDDPETLLEKYLGECLPDGKSIGKMVLRMAISKAAAAEKDAETAKSVMRIFNNADKLGSFLTALGYELDGETVKPS